MSGFGQEESYKRAALTGQWRTPPLPAYASIAGNSSLSQDGTTTASVSCENGQPLLGGIALTDATDDYAAALQEAYLRGAQAAAAMAAQGELMTSASCPEFQMPTRQQQQQQEQQQQQQDIILPHPIVPNPLVTDHPPNTEMLPPPPPAAPIQAGSVGPQMTMQQPPPIHHSLPSTPSSTMAHGVSSSTHPLLVTPLPLQHQQLPYQDRSMSMPNMNFNIEEEKRQKRLARNRASARLRRMRKKNLVEAYEQEVAIMEKTLEALKQHNWGEQDDPSALIDSLSIDRGQQDLTVDERQQVARDILDQQLEYIEMLEEGMREQYILYHLHRDDDNEELKDLQDALQLTPDQYVRLAQSAAGWEEEWRALQTVKSSLQAMRNNNWLWNEGCNSIVEGFLSIMNKSQISKFLLWADHNSESIEDLDGINARLNESPAEGPVFQFGVNNNPDSLLDSGKY